MSYGEHHLQFYDSVLGRSREMTPNEIAAGYDSFHREQDDYLRRKEEADRKRGCDGWLLLLSLASKKPDSQTPIGGDNVEDEIPDDPSPQKDEALQEMFMSPQGGQQWGILLPLPKRNGYEGNP